MPLVFSNQTNTYLYEEANCCIIPLCKKSKKRMFNERCHKKKDKNQCDKIFFVGQPETLSALPVVG